MPIATKISPALIIGQKYDNVWPLVGVSGGDQCWPNRQRRENRTNRDHGKLFLWPG